MIAQKRDLIVDIHRQVSVWFQVAPGIAFFSSVCPFRGVVSLDFREPRYCGGGASMPVSSVWLPAFTSQVDTKKTIAFFQETA
jgi:hypothetical protein